MRSMIIGCAALALASFAAVAGPANASVADFLGHWTSVDPKSRSLVAIDVERTNDGVRIHLWGACHPTACDIGFADGTLFATNVSTDIESGSDRIVAQYGKNGLTTMVILVPNGGRLHYETYTIFSDGSKRSNYHIGEWMQR